MTSLGKENLLIVARNKRSQKAASDDGVERGN